MHNQQTTLAPESLNTLQTKDYNLSVYKPRDPSNALTLLDAFIRRSKRSTKNSGFNRSPILLYNAYFKPNYKDLLKLSTKTAKYHHKKKKPKIKATTSKVETLDLESVEVSSEDGNPITYSNGYFKKISAGDKDVKDDQNRHLPSMRDEDIDEWFR